MKHRLQLLAKVIRVRKRLRDAAAARLSTANGATHAARSTHESSKTLLEGLLDGAARTFSLLQSADALLFFDQNRQNRIRRVAETQETLRHARKEDAARRREVATYEHKLKISEKIYESERRDVAKDSDRKEQEMNDELTATRVAGAS